MTKIIFGDWRGNKELEGIKLIDLHNHSNISDGSDTVGEIVSRAKELNIGVCITDHNRIKGSLLACREILSIPSVELTSSEFNDLLVYFEKEKEAKEFFEKKIEGRKGKGTFTEMWALKLKTREIIEGAKDYNGFVVLPHPFGYGPKDCHLFFGRKKNRDLLEKIDAIEGINGTMGPSKNRRTVKWAEKKGKIIVGGSDSHELKYVGHVLTGCFAETRADFLEEIRRGRNYIIVTKEVGRFARAAAKFNIIKNNIKWIRNRF